jgi:hypothetical protein
MAGNAHSSIWNKIVEVYSCDLQWTNRLYMGYVRPHIWSDPIDIMEVT